MAQEATFRVLLVRLHRRVGDVGRACLSSWRRIAGRRPGGPNQEVIGADIALRHQRVYAVVN